MSDRVLAGLPACYCTFVNNNNNNDYQCQTTACYCTIVYNNNNNIDYHFQTGVAFCPVKRERACGIQIESRNQLQGFRGYTAGCFSDVLDIFQASSQFSLFLVTFQYIYVKFSIIFVRFSIRVCQISYIFFRCSLFFVIF